jgi:hypothetical protein
MKVESLFCSAKQLSFLEHGNYGMSGGSGRDLFIII